MTIWAVQRTSLAHNQLQMKAATPAEILDIKLKKIS